MFDNLLTVQQYACLLGCKLSTVNSWIQRGQLPTVNIAGRIFVYKSAKPTHNVRTKASWKGNNG